MLSVYGASRIVAIAVLLLCGFSPSSVNALSCYGLNDRFFLRCNSLQCTAEFRAREIGTLGACARRVIVESPTADVQSAVLQRLGDSMPVGIYEVTFVHRYYGTPPVTGTEMVDAFSEHQLRAPRLAIKELDEGTNLEQLRREWVSQEHLGLARMVGFWTIELSVLGAGLAVACLSTFAYRRRLIGVQAGRLLGPIAVQIAVFLVAVASIGSFSVPALVGLVAPILLVIWLYEAIAYAWWWFGRKRAKEF